MILSDCHLHSSFSSDSETPIEDMVITSIKKGLTRICFTEHMDYEFPSCYSMNFLFDPNEFFDETNRLIDKYKGKINILRGIEIGMKPELSYKYNELLSDYSWDFVIGSTHLVNNIDPYYSEYWEGKSEIDCVSDYFNTILDNITSCNNFDTVGHLDYILRYAPHKNMSFSYELFCDILDSILKKIIDNGHGLEINSSGYKSGLNAPNPCREIISRYCHLGGEIFTIGSDAHTPEHIAGSFLMVKELLRSLGINHYTVYEKRKPIFLDL